MGFMVTRQGWVRRAALACGLMLVLAPGAAQAQFFGGVFGSRFAYPLPPQEDDWENERAYAPRMLPPRAVFRQLAEDGYRVLSPVIPRGRVYLADVADSETGQHERLVIDAFSGDIVGAYPLGQRIAPPGRVPYAHLPQDGLREGLRAPPPAPQRQSRLTPPARVPTLDDPLVIPGLGAPTTKARPTARVPKPQKPKQLATRPVPVAPGKTGTGLVPKPVPVEAQPLAAPSVAAPSVAPPPLAPAPVAAVPSLPEPVAPALPLPSAPPLEAASPALAPPPQAAAAPAINDIPPAPLDDATPPAKVHTPVNDIPVAPLE